KLIQDEDVLDTWFSSGLWPFATLGWPNTESKDFQRFFPNNMRETAYDILFFWVAREMMMSFGLTDQTPYQKVYFHGIIRDEKGKKISKSMENIAEYDPLNIIAKYGADPLRFTLISNIIPSKDLNLNPGALKSSKNFCNKIWQSANFIFSHLEKIEKVSRINSDFPKDKLNLADQWILSQLNKLQKEVKKNFEEYDYLNAVRSIRAFYWDIFCDWYLEITKIRIYDENGADKTTPISVLFHVLDTTLRLLHPSIPHLTEALWQKLPKEFKEVPALIVAKWPEPLEEFINNSIDEDFELVKSLIHKIRGTRKDFNVKPGLRIPLIIQAGKNKKIIEDSILEISALAHI
ncbi:MAG: class I tRNA ligase family protein, partial [archaeon]|nr:class I tRNA ligase family protein [archaeon]